MLGFLNALFPNKENGFMKIVQIVKRKDELEFEQDDRLVGSDIHGDIYHDHEATDQSSL